MEEVTVFERPMPVAATRMSKEPGSTPATLQFCKSLGFVAGAKRGTGDAAPVASTPAAPKLYSHYSYKNLWGMGKLTVPKEHTRAFLKAYLADFSNGWFGAFTENPGEGCMPMYFDYDLWSRTYPTEDFWAAMEALEKAEIRRFFPGRPASDPVFTSTIATSGVMDVIREDGTKWFKCGIHIYYRRLHVNLEMALYLSTAVIAAAEKAWPASDMTWDKQIDRGVYGAARGLRMVYMFKAKDCPRCAVGELAEDRRRKVRGDRCDMCEGARVVSDTSASMYAPLYRCDGTGRRTIIGPLARGRPTLDLMLECCIREAHIPEPSEGFVVYAGAVPIPHLKIPGRGADPKGILTCSGDSQLAKSTKAAHELVLRGTPRWETLKSVIRRLAPIYATLDVKAIHRNRDTSYKVFITGQGSGHCQNYGKSHRSAVIYFVVTKAGVSQRCWCSCDTVEDRAAGVRCRDYRSVPVPLRVDELGTLFDSTATAWGMSALALTSGVTPSMAALASVFNGVTPLPANPLRTDADAFTPTTATSLFVKEAIARSPDLFNRSTKGGITKVAQSLNFRHGSGDPPPPPYGGGGGSGSGGYCGASL
jgi:hypothetical protein